MAAPRSYFCQNGGNDANDGRDNTGVGLATGTWTEGTLTLTQNGHGYTFAQGDVIYLSAGTGLTVGLYEPTASDANTITFAATSTLPGVGDGNDIAAGDDATGDWASSSGPWATVDKAMNTVAVDDDVWLRSTAAFVESPAIDTAGGTNSEICFAGYTTDIGDEGQATITGMMTDTIATRIQYCFSNIIFDANSVNANCTQLISYEITWRKCVFKNATVNGHTQGSTGCFYECEFLDNAGDGSAMGTGATYINCKFYRNGFSAIDCAGTVVCYNCVFFSNGSLGIDGASTNETFVVAINCTIDGDSKDTTTGIFQNSANRGYLVAINNIVYDCVTGIQAAHGLRDVIINNLVNSNTNDYGGDAEGQEGEVTSAPDFVDEVAGADYTLNVTSPAKGAASDYSADEGDLGAIQLAAVGGGLLMPNKRAGKQ